MAHYPLPTFQHEAIYWQQGITLIAGLDEVGMGALAGPVVAAAVIFEAQLQPTHYHLQTPLIRDSKTLSATQREKAITWIKEKTVAWAVGEASVAEINTLNIRAASHLAMRRAVSTLNVQPELLLIDGRPASPHPAVLAGNSFRGH